MQMLHLKLLSVECMSQPNNQNETDTRLLAGQIFGDGAFTRAPCGPFLQAHPRVSLAHFKGGSARKHGHGENKGAKGTEDWADQSNKAAASTVFITRVRRISWWNSWPSLLNIFHAIQNRKCLNSVFGVVIYIYIEYISPGRSAGISEYQTHHQIAGISSELPLLFQPGMFHLEGHIFCNSILLMEEILHQLIGTSWFKVTFLGCLSDPLKGLSDLQRGDEKVTLNHLVISFSMFFSLFTRFFFKYISGGERLAGFLPPSNWCEKRPRFSNAAISPGQRTKRWQAAIWLRSAPKAFKRAFLNWLDLTLLRTHLLGTSLRYKENGWSSTADLADDHH